MLLADSQCDDDKSHRHVLPYINLTSLTSWQVWQSALGQPCVNYINWIPYWSSRITYIYMYITFCEHLTGNNLLYNELMAKGKLYFG